MQYVMKVFEEESSHSEFRVIDRDGEPWFVLSEVCARLDIAQPASAARLLEDDEKGVLNMHTPGGNQNVTIVNESGLFSLIFRSRKESATKFRKWVTSEVLPAIRKTGTYRGKTPAFIKRANANWNRVEQGYFSVINELAVLVWGRMEQVGHVMADKAPNGVENRPDNSVGRCFSDWLKENHPYVDPMFKYYLHVTPEWEGECRQYPNAMLPLFREYVETVWWPSRFEGYIKTRDPAALPYLQKLLPSKPSKPTLQPRS